MALAQCDVLDRLPLESRKAVQFIRTAPLAPADQARVAHVNAERILRLNQLPGDKPHAQSLEDVEAALNRHPGRGRPAPSSGGHGSARLPAGQLLAVNFTGSAVKSFVDTFSNYSLKNPFAVVLRNALPLPGA